MAHLILPEAKLKALIRHRRRNDHDRRDEVWDGIYVMSPEANFEHQGIATGLAVAFIQALNLRSSRRILAGVNVSDRVRGWSKNYRVPDVAVFLPDNPAKILETHSCGGPDFAVEVISKGDRSREKVDFYSKVGVRELLLVDRDPWQLELYRHDGASLILVGSLGLGHPGSIVSEVLPVSFRLIASEEGPAIEVTHTADGRTWTC